MGRLIEKHYVWIWVKNPYAKEMNNQPEKELRRYRVKEFKKKNALFFLMADSSRIHR